MENRKNISRNNDQNYSQYFMKTINLTEPKISMNPKYKKHEENYSRGT